MLHMEPLFAAFFKESSKERRKVKGFDLFFKKRRGLLSKKAQLLSLLSLREKREKRDQKNRRLVRS